VLVVLLVAAMWWLAAAAWGHGGRPVGLLPWLFAFIVLRNNLCRELSELTAPMCRGAWT
jgi:hypothetical protein